jgi:hypothetical protein
VPDTTLRDDVIGVVAKIADLPAQDRDLHAADVIEVHMVRRYRQVVMVMCRMGKPARKFPGAVIEDIDGRPEALRVRCGRRTRRPDRAATRTEVGSGTAVVPRLQLPAALWSLDIDSELLCVGDGGITDPSRATRRYGVELGAYWTPLDSRSSSPGRGLFVVTRPVHRV